MREIRAIRHVLPTKTKDMRWIRLLMSVIAAMSLWACTGDDPTSVEGSATPFQFEEMPETRATDTFFEEGDIIGVYAVKRNGDRIGTMLAGGNFADNKRYVYRNGSFQPVSQGDMIYPPVGQKLDFYAYYPYQDSPNPIDLTMDGGMGQSAGSGYKNSDHLWAKSERGYINSHTPVSLPFNHVMGLVEVAVKKNGTDIISGASMAGAMIRQKGNLQTGALRISDSTPKSVSMLAWQQTASQYVFRALVPTGNTFADGADAFYFTLGSGGTKKFVANANLPVQSGKTTRFELDMPADVITWEYSLTVTPRFMGFPSEGGMKNFTLASTRTKLVNGNPTAVVESVACTTAVSGPDAGGFTVSGSSVIASQNPSTAFRDATLTFTQSAAGGKSVTVTLEQEGKVDIDTEN